MIFNKKEKAKQSFGIILFRSACFRDELVQEWRRVNLFKVDLKSCDKFKELLGKLAEHFCWRF